MAAEDPNSASSARAIYGDSQSLLHEVLANSVRASGRPADDGLGLLASHAKGPALLSLWFGDWEGQIREQGFAAWKRAATQRLSVVVAAIDDSLSSIVDSVLHHEKYQKLEASWRGLDMLVNQAAGNKRGNQSVRVRLLNVSWREIHKSFAKAKEFDQNELFKKIYEEEFGAPGGIPFSVIVADYEVHPRPTSEHQFDDVAIVEQLSGIAAASFCPMVLGASPSLFGVDDFFDLQQTKNIESGFVSREFLKWRELRQQEDSRFIGIAMPRVLLRSPYEYSDTKEFLYREDTSPDEISTNFMKKNLWGNAAYAWATVLIRTFNESGWLADIRGTERNRVGGGLVTCLPTVSFGTDREGVALKTSTDLIVTDHQEAELARLGFLPLCRCKDTPFAAFYSSQSLQKPQSYAGSAASANASISAMLQYMLCVSRFAHYLKVIARDKLGSATDATEMQRSLEEWVQEYVTPDKHAKLEKKIRRPLSEAEITVEPEPSKPGSYQCRFRLVPHYQLDDLAASIRLKTELSSIGSKRE